jgi:hypothetical protein
MHPPPPSQTGSTEPQPGARCIQRLPRGRTRGPDQLAAGTSSKRTVQSGKLSGKRGCRLLITRQARCCTRPELRFLVEPPAGIEPATPPLPSMRRWFTTPCSTSRPHTVTQVSDAAEGRGVRRGEVARSAVSGKSLARSCTAVYGVSVGAILRQPRPRATGVSGALLSQDDFGSSVEQEAWGWPSRPASTLKSLMRIGSPGGTRAPACVGRRLVSAVRQEPRQAGAAFVRRPLRAEFGIGQATPRRGGLALVGWAPSVHPWIGTGSPCQLR